MIKNQSIHKQGKWLQTYFETIKDGVIIYTPKDKKVDNRYQKKESTEILLRNSALNKILECQASE